MPNIKVMDMTGNEVSNIELSDAIFGITPNVPAMHTMVVNYLANQRQGTQSTLTRTEVSPGDRRVQVTQDRVPSVLLSGHTAVLLSDLSPEPIVSL